jgi:hypothetical protein
MKFYRKRTAALVFLALLGLILVVGARDVKHTAQEPGHEIETDVSLVDGKPVEITDIQVRIVVIIRLDVLVECARVCRQRPCSWTPWPGKS